MHKFAHMKECLSPFPNGCRIHNLNPMITVGVFYLFGLLSLSFTLPSLSLHLFSHSIPSRFFLPHPTFILITKQTQ
jgi:hypothetical protein